MSVEVTLGLVSREYPRDAEDAEAVDDVGAVDEAEAAGFLEDDDAGRVLLPLFFFSTPPNKASRLASFSRLCFGPAVLEPPLLDLGGPNRASRLTSLLLRLELMAEFRMVEKSWRAKRAYTFGLFCLRAYQVCHTVSTHTWIYVYSSPTVR